MGKADFLSFNVSCVLFICFLTSLCLGKKNITTFKDSKTTHEIFLSFKNDVNTNGPTTDQELLEDIQVLNANWDYLLRIELIPDWAEFFVVQTHVYLHNVTLSYNLKKVASKYVTGQNIGLMLNATSSGLAQLYLLNENPFDVTALLTVVAYSKDVPVPGGCNMEASVAVAPWLGMNVTGPAVVVTTAPAQGPPAWGTAGACDMVVSSLQYQAYHLYLPEKDFSKDFYFEFIRKMLTVERIIENGRKVPDLGMNPLRHMFSAYHGTGSVFAVVVSDPAGQQAAYVPALTYTCSPTHYTDTCQVLTSAFSRSLCALTLFLGLFVCLFGHSFFQTELFLFSTLMGGISSYIAAAPLGYSDAANMVIATVGGVTVGNVWLLLWWLFGSPLLSVIMATAALGYLVASTVFYSLLADLPYMVSDLNYWLGFSCVVLLVGVVCVPQPNRVNVLACAVVGAHAVIVPIDHYVGGNLKYIFINTVRRATVPGFGEAVIDPPFQTKDKILVMLWVVLAITGYVMQSQRFGDRPAFPPSPHPWGTPIPSSTPRVAHSERRPLLAPSPGSDSVFS